MAEPGKPASTTDLVSRRYEPTIEPLPDEAWESLAPMREADPEPSLAVPLVFLAISLTIFVLKITGTPKPLAKLVQVATWNPGIADLAALRNGCPSPRRDYTSTRYSATQ